MCSFEYFQSKTVPQIPCFVLDGKCPKIEQCTPNIWGLLGVSPALFSSSNRGGIPLCYHLLKTMNVNLISGLRRQVYCPLESLRVNLASRWQVDHPFKTIEVDVVFKDQLSPVDFRLDVWTETRFTSTLYFQMGTWWLSG